MAETDTPVSTATLSRPPFVARALLIALDRTKNYDSRVTHNVDCAIALETALTSIGFQVQRLSNQQANLEAVVLELGSIIQEANSHVYYQTLVYFNCHGTRKLPNDLEVELYDYPLLINQGQFPNPSRGQVFHTLSIFDCCNADGAIASPSSQPERAPASKASTLPVPNRPFEPSTEGFADGLDPMEQCIKLAGLFANGYSWMTSGMQWIGQINPSPPVGKNCIGTQLAEILNHQLFDVKCSYHKPWLTISEVVAAVLQRMPADPALQTSIRLTDWPQGLADLGEFHFFDTRRRQDRRYQSSQVAQNPSEFDRPAGLAGAVVQESPTIQPPSEKQSIVEEYILYLTNAASEQYGNGVFKKPFQHAANFPVWFKINDGRWEWFVDGLSDVWADVASVSDFPHRATGLLALYIVTYLLKYSPTQGERSESVARNLLLLN